MRILLDESLPWRLGPLLVGHDVVPVAAHGWSGVKNGELLRRASLEFFAFMTGDTNLEHQQNLATLPVAVVVLVAKSNRLVDLEPLVPEALVRLTTLAPRTLIRVGG